MLILFLQIYLQIRFYSFVFFSKIPEPKIYFQQVGALVKKNISDFCLEQVTLYLKPCQIQQTFKGTLNGPTSVSTDDVTKKFEIAKNRPSSGNT